MLVLSIEVFWHSFASCKCIIKGCIDWGMSGCGVLEVNIFSSTGGRGSVEGKAASFIHRPLASAAIPSLSSLHPCSSIYMCVSRSHYRGCVILLALHSHSPSLCAGSFARPSLLPLLSLPFCRHSLPRPLPPNLWLPLLLVPPLGKRNLVSNPPFLLQK